VVKVLRAATNATVSALLHAHPAVAVARSSTQIETAANQIVTLSQLLQVALDNYRYLLLDDDLF
jgi:hypothetical protein